MKTLSEPQKTVIGMLAKGENPRTMYLDGQLRLIYAALERRGLIVMVDGEGWKLTPLAYDYVRDSKSNTG